MNRLLLCKVAVLHIYQVMSSHAFENSIVSILISKLKFLGLQLYLPPVPVPMQ